MTSKPKTAINTKILAAVAITIVAVAAVAVAAVYMLSQPSNSPSTLPSMSLTLIGSNGQQKVLTEQDIAALEAYSAQGGLKTSSGVISGVGTYTGVLVTDLLNLVGGMTSDQTLTVTASDGYTMDFTYDQVVNGQDFPTYDPETGSEAASTQPMKLVLTYYLNGAALSSDEGPLRLSVLGSEGLITNGHFWVKMVTQLEINSPTSPSPSPSPSPTHTATPTPAPSSSPTPTPTPTPVVTWNILFSGGTSVNMTDLDFEDQASQNPATWTHDESDTTWAGTPLYQLVNWYVDNGYISAGVLSLGYNVSVIGSDDYTIVLEDSRVQANNNIIIANNANGTTLSDKYYPLTLTGSGVTKKESVKCIAQIQINTALPDDMTLTIKGANGTTLVFDTSGIAALPSVSGMGGMNSHGEIKGVGNYTGISILSLVNMVGGMPSNSFVRLTAADTYTKDYTYEQITSGTGYGTFDPVTNDATDATQPITAILAYAVDDELLSPSSGPLRSAFIGPEGLLTLSSMWVKSTVQVEVVQLA